MADVARKVMGDIPIAYVEGVGGKRVSEDETIAVSKNDVRKLLQLVKTCAHWYLNRFYPLRLGDEGRL